MTGGAQGDTVEFFDGGAKIGSGTLDANGTATYAWTPGTRGAHTLMAKFPGTARANASQSGQQTIDVAQVRHGVEHHDQRGRRCPGGARFHTRGHRVACWRRRNRRVQGRLRGAGPGSRRRRRQGQYQWTPTSEGSCTLVAVVSGRDGVAGSTAPRPSRWRPKPVGNIESATAIANVVGAKGRFAAEHLRTGDPGQRGGTVTFKDGDTVVGAATVDGSGVATVSWTPAVEGQRVIAPSTRGPATSMRRPMPFPSASHPPPPAVVTVARAGAPEARVPRRLVLFEVSPLVRPSLTSRPDEGSTSRCRTAGHARRRREPMSDRRVRWMAAGATAAVAAGFVVALGRARPARRRVR